MTVLAIRTGQKDGAAYIVTAPAASAASAATTSARLARVASINPPVGVWTARPKSPPTVVTNPTASWLQCCWVTRKTFK
jgi:hypothetical protein